jgi:exopolysaccharide biosynthesis protein
MQKTINDSLLNKRQKRILAGLWVWVIVAGAFYLTSCSHGKTARLVQSNVELDTLHWDQIISDTFFQRPQIITRLFLHKDNLTNTRLTFNYQDTILKPTSSFAEERNALAAINAGFFDTKKGGSVTYFELSDTVIAYSKVTEAKRREANYLFNGAVILHKDSGLILQAALPEQIYEQSKREAAVLISGPMLLSHSTKVSLPDRPFSNNRHPRTCICIRTHDLVFLTIDGRSTRAAGMSLHELQDYLLSIGCRDAINLDGGGSTTMWIADKGVVNFPSDKTGERPVANALLILQD